MEANATSGLLSPDENMKVWAIIKQAHRKNQSLSLAVVKLYLSDQVTDHTTWVERFTGTVSFTKDYSRKSYFIQIFDMDFYQKEIYLEFEYNNPSIFFHTFEAENSLAGLSFAEDREGQNFLSVVQKKLNERRAKCRMKEKPVESRVMAAPSQPVRTELPRPARGAAAPGSPRTKNKEKRKLNKMDIGGPMTDSFVHVSGVKTDGSGGMKMVDNSHLIQDPVIRTMLKKAGIPFDEIGKTEEERAENIEKIKMQTMNSGLYEKYEKKERRRTMRQNARMPPPPPSRPIPSPMASPRNSPISSPRPPKRDNPPPPPPGDRQRPRPGPTKASGGSGGPPPPPPPPGPGPPPPPVVSSSDTVPRAVKPPPPAKPVSTRDNLLAEIQGGFKLKQIERTDSGDSRPGSVKSNDAGGGNGLGDVLQRRIEAMGFSSDDDSDDDDDDDEWEE